MAGESATIDLLGVVVTDADCYAAAAFDATMRILAFTGNSHVPVAISTLKGKTEFPHDWRLDSYKVAAFPILNQERDQHMFSVLISGQQLLLDVLRTGRDIIVLCTGKSFFLIVFDFWIVCFVCF